MVCQDLMLPGSTVIKPCSTRSSSMCVAVKFAFGVFTHVIVNRVRTELHVHRQLARHQEGRHQVVTHMQD